MKALLRANIVPLIALVLVAWQVWDMRSGRIASLKNEVEVQEALIAALKADQVAQQNQKATLARFDTLSQEIKNALSDPSRVCFDPGDTGRVQRLWDE